MRLAIPARQFLAKARGDFSLQKLAFVTFFLRPSPPFYTALLDRVLLGTPLE